jgi:hypothetical protein
MSSAPGSFFVPTLPIDLAWHTHQLMASRVRDIVAMWVIGFTPFSIPETPLNLSVVSSTSKPPL